jgi:hypothetical protein
MDKKYLAGIFDGEGSIGLYPQKIKSTNTGWKFQPQLTIKQVNPTKEFKKSIKSVLNEQNINFSVQDKDSGEYNIRMQSRDSIVNFWEMINNHIYIKKTEMQIMCGEIIPMLNSNIHKTKSGIIKLMEKKKEMDKNKSSSGDSNRKYNLEYFEEELGA